jgi:hypothetical protein
MFAICALRPYTALLSAGRSRFERVAAASVGSNPDIAGARRAREKADRSNWMTLSLAFLAPDIVKVAMEGEGARSAAPSGGWDCTATMVSTIAPASRSHPQMFLRLSVQALHLIAQKKIARPCDGPSRQRGKPFWIGEKRTQFLGQPDRNP